MDVQSMAASLVGPLIPWIVQLVRLQVLRVTLTPRNAQLLSLGLSAGAVAIAYFVTDRTPTGGEFLANFAGAFTLGQVVYRQFETQIKGVGPVEDEPPTP